MKNWIKRPLQQKQRQEKIIKTNEAVTLASILRLIPFFGQDQKGLARNSDRSTISQNLSGG